MNKHKIGDILKSRDLEAGMVIGDYSGLWFCLIESIEDELINFTSVDFENNGHYLACTSFCCWDDKKEMRYPERILIDRVNL